MGTKSGKSNHVSGTELKLHGEHVYDIRNTWTWRLNHAFSRLDARFSAETKPPKIRYIIKR